MNRPEVNCIFSEFIVSVGYLSLGLSDKTQGK